jgi:hypothetical protein
VVREVQSNFRRQIEACFSAQNAGDRDVLLWRIRDPCGYVAMAPLALNAVELSGIRVEECHCRIVGEGKAKCQPVFGDRIW